MNKIIENAIDIGVGLMILVFAISTAYFGLITYYRTPLNHELLDKNTTGTEANLLTSDDLDNTTLENIAVTLTSSAKNADNIRSVILIIAPEENLASEYKIELNITSISTYNSSLFLLNEGIKRYNESFAGTKYVANLNAGKYKCFLTEQQSRNVVYILIQ